MCQTLRLRYPLSYLISLQHLMIGDGRQYLLFIEGL